MNSTVSKFLAATAAVILVFGVVAVAHRWLAESFGASVATVTVFAFFGVALAVVLWVASARFTMAIYKAALHHSEYMSDISSTTMRSLAPTYRVAERHHLIDAQTQMTALRIAAREAKPSQPQDEPAVTEQPVVAPRFPRRQRRVEFL